MAEEKKGLLSRLIDDRMGRMEEQAGGGLAAPQEEAEPAEPSLSVREEFEALLDASPISARRWLQDQIDDKVVSPEAAKSLGELLPEDQYKKLKIYHFNVNEETGKRHRAAEKDARRWLEKHDKESKTRPKLPPRQSSAEPMQGAAGLAQASDPEFDEAFESHPGFQALEADEPASPELESELAKKVVNAREYIFNEGNYPKVLANLNKRSTDFFEAAADTAFHIALSEHNKATGRGEVENPAVYFGDGGMLSTMVDTVFEIAQHHDIPGAYDPNEYAAAMGYAYQLAGEYIMENGDENAIAEAQELMADVALTRQDGTMVESRDDAMAVRQRRNSMQQQDLAALEAGQAAMPNESFASPRATMRQLPGGIG